jgi:hypothetical protein
MGVWRSGSTAVVRAAIACAGLFEAVIVVSTQLRSVRLRSPWQDDPYNVMVSFALFAVPVLAVMLALRLAALRSPRTRTTTTGDAERQMLRAALALLAVIDATLGAQWAAVALGEHRPAWHAATGWLVAGTATVTLWAVPLTVLAIRAGATRRLGRPWNKDWLGDLASLFDRLPGAGRLNVQPVVAGIRRHAVLVFATASVAGAAAIIGALAVGEGWTDPWLVSWALAVETASNFAACMIVNAVAGVVARPAGRRNLEIAITAGCVAVQLAVAFREPLWRALTGRSPDTVTALTELTAGAAVLACAVALVATVRHADLSGIRP